MEIVSRSKTDGGSNLTDVSEMSSYSGILATVTTLATEWMRMATLENRRTLIRHFARLFHRNLPTVLMRRKFDKKITYGRESKTFVRYSFAREIDNISQKFEMGRPSVVWGCGLHLHTFGAAETSRKMKVECYECNVQVMVFVDKMYFGATSAITDR